MLCLEIEVARTLDMLTSTRIYSLLYLLQVSRLRQRRWLNAWPESNMQAMQAEPQSMEPQSNEGVRPPRQGCRISIIDWVTWEQEKLGYESRTVPCMTLAIGRASWYDTRVYALIPGRLQYS
jgi:hypothetical protein